MSRVKPLSTDQIPDLMDVFDPVIERMGFIPNSQLVMAYKPDLLRAFVGLGKAIFKQEEGSISPSSRA